MDRTSTPATRAADRRALATLAAAMIALFAGPIIMAEAFYVAPVVGSGGQ